MTANNKSTQRESIIIPCEGTVRISSGTGKVYELIPTKNGKLRIQLRQPQKMQQNKRRDNHR